MKRGTLSPLLVFLTALIALGASAQVSTTTNRRVPGAREELGRLVEGMKTNLYELEQSHAALRETAEKLAALYSELSVKAERVAQLAEPGTPSRQHRDDRLAAVEEMKQTMRSHNRQYLALQNKIQQDTREFNLISNIMKTKHEAAKNAVNNIR